LLLPVILLTSTEGRSSNETAAVAHLNEKRGHLVSKVVTLHNLAPMLRSQKEAASWGFLHFVVHEMLLEHHEEIARGFLKGRT